MKILVTGGCGFIGSHIVDELILKGHDVLVLDNLEYQVHKGILPDYLNKSAKYVFGDIRDKEIIKKSLDDVDVVFHEAACVGVGQSMYEIEKYTDVNTLGTAKLLDVIVNGNYGIKKMIVASSMSIYGEGMYNCQKCNIIVNPLLRPKEQLKDRVWEHKCSECGDFLIPVGTKEEKPLQPTSVYAITKKDQEELFLSVGKAYGLKTVALRYFNAYGPRQSLSNPYTGVCAIFSARIKNNNRPIIFEDGMQSRDFISVKDIAQANMIAMENNNANYQALNVGSGKGTSIKEISEVLASQYNKNIKPDLTNKFREGDIRHCFADTQKIERLGFKPKVSFEEGMRELVLWGERVKSEDNVDKAINELRQRGLVEA